MAMIAVLISGCIRIPEENLTISHRIPFESRGYAVDYAAAGLHAPGVDQTAQKQLAPALNADGFSLVSWNIFKGKKAGWAKDFRKFIRNTDILILQEAYLTENLQQMLRRESYHWDMTAAFEYRQIEAGVLTAARTASSSISAFRQTEPITRIPKSVLITRYPMTGTNRELLVANIHAINFAMDISVFQKQIDRLAAILTAHRGPMIVSGDFNTWNVDRMASVNALADDLYLSAVGFDENRRSRIFGFEIDHVFYRGLEVKNAETPMVSTSDHNPLLVVFKLADETDIGL